MASDTDLRVIIEGNIPFVPSRLSEMVRVTFLPPEGFTPAAVADADALVVRTRTRIGPELLSGSKVRFVATATIGMDHIDLPWCRSRGITVANAPGCNAPGVAQYVLASIMDQGFVPGPDVTLGIVGVGHVGRIVEQWGRALGFNILLCDPPRARREGGEGFVELDEIARRADIVTLHTPLTLTGPDTTRHLIDGTFLSMCARRPLVINAARGPVVDTGALCRAIDLGAVRRPVIDCWEGEPRISGELLARAAVATPHIAGYSLEGKMRATRMVLDSLTEFFGLGSLPPMEADLSVASAPSAEAIARSYSPAADTARLKAAPGSFEDLRNNYSYRREPA